MLTSADLYPNRARKKKTLMSPDAIHHHSASRLMRRHNPLLGTSLYRRPSVTSPASADKGQPPTTPGGRWLLAVLSIELVSALSILLPLLFGLEPWSGREVPASVSTLTSILLPPVALHAAWRLIRQHHRDRIEASTSASLMDTALSTTPEWLWAVGETVGSPSLAALAGNYSALSPPNWWDARAVSSSTLLISGPLGTQMQARAGTGFCFPPATGVDGA